MLILFACASLAADPQPSVDAAALPAEYQAGRVKLLLDVRSESEFSEGHVAGALHIPVTDLPGRLAELEAHRGQPIHVICAVGGRSAAATAALDAAGFDAVNIPGGTKGWIAAGHPVVAGNADARALATAATAGATLGAELSARMMSSSEPVLVCSDDNSAATERISEQQVVTFGNISLQKRDVTPAPPSWVSAWMAAQGSTPTAASGVDPVGLTARVITPLAHDCVVWAEAPIQR